MLEDLNQERLQLIKEHRLEGSQLEDLDSQLDEILKVRAFTPSRLCLLPVLIVSFIHRLGLHSNRKNAQPSFSRRTYTHGHD